MITYAPNSMKYARPIMALNGLSTDDKPIQRYDGRCIPNGSTFYEIDTACLYRYDAETNVWYYQINYNNHMDNHSIAFYTTENDGSVFIQYEDGTCFASGWHEEIVS